jgi:hypothetical protein
MVPTAAGPMHDGEVLAFSRRPNGSIRGGVLDDELAGK